MKLYKWLNATSIAYVNSFIRILRFVDGKAIKSLTI